MNGKIYSFDLARTPSGSMVLLLDNEVFWISIVDFSNDQEHNAIQLMLEGHIYKVTLEDRRSNLLRGLIANRLPSPTLMQLTAPMPGRVARIEVKPGESILAGSGLLVLEAMKMENELKAAVSGIVEKIFVETGRVVEKGEILLSIKAH